MDTTYFRRPRTKAWNRCLLLLRGASREMCQYRACSDRVPGPAGTGYAAITTTHPRLAPRLACAWAQPATAVLQQAPADEVLREQVRAPQGRGPCPFSHPVSLLHLGHPPPRALLPAPRSSRSPQHGISSLQQAPHKLPGFTEASTTLQGELLLWPVMMSFWKGFSPSPTSAYSAGHKVRSSR